MNMATRGQWRVGKSPQTQQSALCKRPMQTREQAWVRMLGMVKDVGEKHTKKQKHKAFPWERWEGHQEGTGRHNSKSL